MYNPTVYMFNIILGEQSLREELTMEQNPQKDDGMKRESGGKTYEFGMVR